MKTFAPNYTQIPNSLIEAMPELSDAELRVALAISRQTFGWHRERAVLSQTFLAKATGMSTVACSKAGTSLAARGIVTKSKSRGANVFQLVVENLPGPLTPLTGPVEPINAVDRQPINAVDTKKEREKEIPPKGGRGNNATFRLVQLWKRDFRQQFGTDYVETPGDWSAAKRILATVPTPEDVVEVARAAWGKKGRDFWACENKTSSLSEFVTNWNKVKAELSKGKPSPAPDGARYGPAGPQQF